MKNKLFAYPILGRAGLGNMLFPWARAEVFSLKNKAKILAPQWVHIKIGPFIRRERDKRYYIRLFDNSNYIRGIKKYIILLKSLKISETDFENCKKELNENKKTTVIFKGMKDFFEPFIEHNNYLHLRLLDILHPRLKPLINNFKDEEFIGVHVRRGDFLQKQGNKKFYPTPDEWYLSSIKNLREILGFPMKCKVFSDGKKQDLTFLSNLENIEIIKQNKAIVDLLKLSRSKFLITSSGSTFSMWAAFLGQMPSIWYPKEKIEILTKKPNYQMQTKSNGDFNSETEKFIKSLK